MKALMYHYICPDSGEMPFFRYLGLDSFKKQLDYFSEKFGFVDRDEFLASIANGRPMADGVVLTFDDGFSCHFDYVLPELRRRGLWGIFYIPTGMYSTGKLLDVHRIHVLLGKFGGVEVLSELRKILMDDMLSHAHIPEYRLLTYGNQKNDENTTLVKRILNYYISYEYRGLILDRLMALFFKNEGPVCSKFYMTSPQIKETQDAGMLVGSHSATHSVFSKLDVAAQRKELEDSFCFLDEATGGLAVRTFCYPYGGFHSFTAATEQILTELGCRFSFNVESRDISVRDLSNRPQALPRYDCNEFPHGEAEFGHATPLIRRGDDKGLLGAVPPPHFLKKDGNT